MFCKNHKIEMKREPQLGGPDITIRIDYCLLKLKSKLDQLKIYDALFKKKLEGSILNDFCPVAAGNRWNECPFYEK